MHVPRFGRQGIDSIATETGLDPDTLVRSFHQCPKVLNKGAWKRPEVIVLAVHFATTKEAGICKSSTVIDAH
jgi:hypothetical protein